MKTDDFNIDDLIESLRGTATMIDEHLPDGMNWEDLTMQDHNKIDDEIFCCELCGWWHETSQMSEEEQICQECQP